jgi:hypothetical protein
MAIKKPSVIKQLWDLIPKLLLVAFLFGAVPWALYQAACGEVRQTELKDAYKGAKPRFGADATPSSSPPTPAKSKPAGDAGARK